MILRLEDRDAGAIASVAGGDLRADVVSATTGSGSFVRKHLGQVRYTDIVLTFGLGLDESVYRWIEAAWNGENVPKSGTIVSADGRGKIRERMSFTDAVITETRFPTVDGASKDPGLLSVCLAPARVEYAKASGTVAAKSGKQKRWLTSNFRLEISGLDTSHVHRVEGFTVRSDPQKVDFPDLIVHLAASRGTTWRQWLDDFVRKARDNASAEKSGSLAFVSPDHKSELARVKLEGLGIYGLSMRSAPSARAVPRLTAEMYCQRMHLAITKK